MCETSNSIAFLNLHISFLSFSLYVQKSGWTIFKLNTYFKYIVVLNKFFYIYKNHITPYIMLKNLNVIKKIIWIVSIDWWANKLDPIIRIQIKEHQFPNYMIRSAFILQYRCIFSLLHTDFLYLSPSSWIKCKAAVPTCDETENLVQTQSQVHKPAEWMNRSCIHGQLVHFKSPCLDVFKPVNSQTEMIKPFRRSIENALITLH